MTFFSSTPKYKELRLLEHIEKKPQTSQHEIAREIGSAASMVNNYIDRLEEENYLVRDYKSAKVVHYNITPEGIKRKNYLALTYFHELLKLYKLAEENIENFFQSLEDKGYQKILFYGAGEVAETILGVIKERKNKSLKLLALVDDSTETSKRELQGYKVISRDQIKDYDHDGIVITSYTFEENIRRKLEEINYPDEKINRFFSNGAI